MLDLQISVLEIIETIRVSFKALFLSLCSFVSFNVVGYNVVSATVSYMLNQNWMPGFGIHLRCCAALSEAMKTMA
jgi:hypothetical protein